MKWMKRIWYQIKLFLCKKSTMLLPTLKNSNPPPTELINKNEIQYVFIWIDANGSKYIGFALNGYLHKIVWSLELEYWLNISGILLVWIPKPPYELEFSIAENVINIPNDLPNPVNDNFQASINPKIG